MTDGQPGGDRDEEPRGDDGPRAGDEPGCGDGLPADRQRASRDDDPVDETPFAVDEDWLDEGLDEEALDEDEDLDWDSADDEELDWGSVDEEQRVSDSDDAVVYEEMWRGDASLTSDDVDRALAEAARSGDPGERPPIDLSLEMRRADDGRWAHSFATGPEEAAGQLTEGELMIEQSRIIRGLWKVASADPLMSVGLLRTLLAAAASAGDAPGRRAADVLRGLQVEDPVLRLTYARNFRREVGTLRYIYEELFADGCMSVASTHWAWENETVAIGIEVLMTSPPLLPRRHLRHCVEALRRTDKPTRCLLLVSTEPPNPKETPKPSTKEWLGALLWRHVEPRLRELMPIDESAGLIWSQLLDESLELGRRRAAPQR